MLYRFLRDPRIMYSTNGGPRRSAPCCPSFSRQSVSILGWPATVYHESVGHSVAASYCGQNTCSRSCAAIQSTLGGPGTFSRLARIAGTTDSQSLPPGAGLHLRDKRCDLIRHLGELNRSGTPVAVQAPLD